MVDEIKMGLEFVNSRCKTDYEAPDEVILGAVQLADKMLAGEDVDVLFDAHIMAINLFRAGGVIQPLRSYNMRKASKIWLSRNSGR